MKWLVIVDNPHEKDPKGWVLKELNSFIEFLKEYAFVVPVVFSENTFFRIEIKFDKKQNLLKLTEKEITLEPFDGVVISMTRNGTNILAENEQIRKNFMNILSNLKKEAPVIFCTGEPAFNRLKEINIFKNLKIVFHKKIAIKWFNHLLRDLVKDIIK